MITCPNCNHQNPDGANQCEACYTPLPSMVACPSCGSAIQADASFCGQCGADLRSGSQTPIAPTSQPASQPTGDPDSAPGATISSFPSTASGPDSTIKTQNFLAPDPPEVASPEVASPEAPANPTGDPVISSASTPNSSSAFDIPDLVEPDPLLIPEPIGSSSTSIEEASEPTENLDPSAIGEPTASPTVNNPPQTPAPPAPAARPMVTQLQTVSVRLRHVQTATAIELPKQLSVVRIGKPNDRTPPDIDVSGFPDSEIVSRTHANLRVEGDVYYVEDVGSSNGTYVNGLPLPAGNRHRLRPGDRIALGKGDKVSFIFEAAS